jgi:hypothetical protein
MRPAPAVSLGSLVHLVSLLLLALAPSSSLQVLKCEIVVHSVGMPVVRLGEQYSSSCSITLCYLRHSFGLGEHYNSVQPAGTSLEPVAAA